VEESGFNLQRYLALIQRCFYQFSDIVIVVSTLFLLPQPIMDTSKDTLDSARSQRVQDRNLNKELQRTDSTCEETVTDKYAFVGMPTDSSAYQIRYITCRTRRFRSSSLQRHARMRTQTRGSRIFNVMRNTDSYLMKILSLYSLCSCGRLQSTGAKHWWITLRRTLVNRLSTTFF